MSLECFPSLQLLVACCPDPSVAPPEFHGCPAEFLSMRPSCCMPGVVVAVLKALETLSPQLVELMPLEGSYQETVTSIGGLMRTYLLDSDHQQMEAWRLYSLAFARTAIMEVDPIKDRFMQMQHVQDSQQLLRVAIQSSRRLLHSMFRLESLYIFLLGHTATTLQLKMQDVSPENVLEPFQPALNLYEVGMNTFDLLAYSIIPNLEAMIKDPQGRGFSMLQPPSRNHSAEEISLLAVSLGSWAKTGFLTLWSVLQHRSTALRVFILGDARGLEAVAEAVEELQKQEHGMLEGVSFEPLDFERDPNFRAYLEKYPKDCSFGAAGKAILARAVCHLVLPHSVTKVISLDLGDVLVLEDLRNLWQEFENMEDHHLLAASHAVALSHINAGVVLYHVERMRSRRFHELTLQAVHDQQRARYDPTCLRDQSIINTLHSFREEFGYQGPSPVMILPCAWSVFPTTEWLSYWNSPERWLPQLRERRRYPGMVSVTRLEVFCPDEMDVLSAWAFLPMSDVNRQERLRAYALYEGHKKERYCSADRSGRRCCQCGEKVKLLHVAGDMKNWPSMQALLRAYMPPFKELPVKPFDEALSKDWTGGSERLKHLHSQTVHQAVLAAKTMGLQALFGPCATLRCQASGRDHLQYVAVPMTLSLPLLVEVETTALQDAHLLLGIESHSGTW
ncbi:unnamed protein product [Durusdinium trenchii]|uniref:Uncharacterized protein n=1 Tax=Durusdinium trenchii TaxID=1381693 RepID=A0ABP0RN73_9DINO